MEHSTVQETHRKEFLIYLAMAAAPLTVYIIFFILPNLQTLVYSFFKWDGVSPEKVFVGLDNYVNLILREPLFSKSLRNTVTYTAMLIFFGTISGLALALLLKVSTRINSFFRSLFFAPGVLCAIAVGLMWKIGLYDPTIGAVNGVLKMLGLKSLTATWLSGGTEVVCIVLIHIWTFMGFSMIMYIAGLNAISEDLYEAALIDGAGRVKTFIRVTLPLLGDTTGTVVLLALINGFTCFDYVYFLTKGGTNGSSEVLATLLYKQMFTYGSVGKSAAISVMLLLVILVFSLLQRQLSRRDW